MSYCIPNTRILLDNKNLEIYNNIINSRNNSCIMSGYLDNNRVIIKLGRNINAEFNNYRNINSFHNLLPFILPILNETNRITINNKQYGLIILPYLEGESLSDFINNIFNLNFNFESYHLAKRNYYYHTQNIFDILDINIKVKNIKSNPISIILCEIIRQIIDSNYQFYLNKLKLTDQNLGNFLVVGNIRLNDRILNPIVNIDCEFLTTINKESIKYFLIPIDSIINLFTNKSSVNGIKKENYIPPNSYCQLVIDAIRNDRPEIFPFLNKLSVFKGIFHEIDFGNELPKIKSIPRKRPMLKRQKHV